MKNQANGENRRKLCTITVISSIMLTPKLNQHLPNKLDDNENIDWHLS
jgi:hypothetical protein